MLIYKNNLSFIFYFYKIKYEIRYVLLKYKINKKNNYKLLDQAIKRIWWMPLAIRSDEGRANLRKLSVS